ncbi:hypothetical protein HZH68_002672 [Vespula germanica]|uniref:MADF domain-containing protein n=1 Tax=Vespula germanica TaxID=30212 RepID=A0A834NMP7_VESGE|nr:hypothetical protein HZH68_002672 [Vespula germanica]
MANDTIVKFIQLYRSYECLWNVSSEDYGSKLSRNAAFDMISRKMQIPGFGPREVARKIKNLKSAYQQEIKKIEKSEEKSGTGGAYRPRVIWFDLLDDFLRKSEKPSQCDLQFDNDRSNDRSKTIRQTFYNDNQGRNVTNLKKNLSTYESSSEIESSSASKRKRSSVVDVLLDERRKRRRKKEDNAIKVDEYKSFGKYVAASLGRMPFEYAVSAETEIHSVIIKYKVYAMRKIVYPTAKTMTTTIAVKVDLSCAATPKSLALLLQLQLSQSVHVSSVWSFNACTNESAQWLLLA